MSKNVLHRIATTTATGSIREATPRRRRLTAIVLIGLFALACAVSLRGNRAPAPLAADAPADLFSAARALPVLARILGDERPHPTGSAANAAVRDRIVAEFARLGLPAQVQRRFACGGANCATVENIVARIPGASADGAVLLSAHYDSVAASPGASDDGAGVAVLIEVARALQAGPQLPRDVWLLANDGEELGLIGAEAFAREPEFARIGSVVNLEARGTTGASLLIETQPGNAAVIARVRAALSHAGGSSLDYEIYKTLPNDTDFTVYRREGLAGANFAWAQGAERYHTPLDNLAHLDPGSLQQHGDNALAMVRSLTTTGPLESDHDAVFFGMPGVGLATWPATWNPALLALAVLAWATLVLRLARAGRLRLGALAGAAMGVFTGLTMLAGLGWGLYALLQTAGATPAPWTAQGGFLIATCMLLAVPVGLVLGHLLQRWCGVHALAAASLVPFAAIAAGSLAMPGASYLGLVPLLAGALGGHLRPHRPAVWAGVAAVVAAALCFPYAALGYSAMGHPGLPTATVLSGLILLPLLPALLGLGRGTAALGLLALLAMLAAGVLALARPAFDIDVPRPANLLYASSGEDARLYLQPRAALPPGFLKQAGFAATTAPVFPWQGRGFPGPAGPALKPPSLQVEAGTVNATTSATIVSEPVDTPVDTPVDQTVDHAVEQTADGTATQGRRQVRLRLRSQRGASEGGLVLPGDIDIASIRVQGEPLAPSRWHGQPTEWRKVAVIGLPAEGALFEFELAAGRPLEVYGYDSSHGLPAALRPLVQARDAVAVPIAGGDTTVAWTRRSGPPARALGP